MIGEARRFEETEKGKGKDSVPGQWINLNKALRHRSLRIHISISGTPGAGGLADGNGKMTCNRLVRMQCACICTYISMLGTVCILDESQCASADS